MFIKFLFVFVLIVIIVQTQSSCNFAGFRGCAGSNICAYNNVPNINATYCVKWTTNYASGSFCGFPPYNTTPPTPVTGCPKCGIYTVNPYFCLDASDGCIFWDEYYKMCTRWCKYENCDKNLQNKLRNEN